MSQARFIAAAAALRAAKNEYDAAFLAAHPVGGSVSWMLGGGLRHGVVLRHGYSDRIEVRNASTGQAYWIHGHNVLDAAGGAR